MRATLCLLTTGMIALALAASPSSVKAQVTYNGWNLGPDYGSMLNQRLQRQQMMQQEMQQREIVVVQQVMQDPRAQALYQQHRAQGGQLSFPQFAYQYAAMDGFTPDEIARFRQSEAANRQREQQAWDGLQQAERNRAQAQQILTQPERGGARTTGTQCLLRSC